MVEYTETTTKKGKRLVFLKIPEFLMDQFGLGTEEELEKFKNSSDEIVCTCPFCASKRPNYDKKKLYIKGDLSLGNCFVCGRAFINVSDELDLEIKTPELFNNYCGMGTKPFNLVRLEDPEWSLERFRDEFSDYDEEGYQYLIKRNPYFSSLYKDLGFKFFGHHIAMPFFDGNNEVYYYQIRFNSPSSKIRYFFPRISAKPPYVIKSPHGENRWIISEGIFDAVGNLINTKGAYNMFSILGSNISDYQLEILRSFLPGEIKIYMDKTEISRRIRDKIRTIIDYCPITIIKSEGEDPEERMMRMRRTRPGSEVGWILPQTSYEQNNNFTRYFY